MKRPFYERFHAVRNRIESPELALALHGQTVLLDESYEWDQGNLVLDVPRRSAGYPNFRVSPLPGMIEDAVLLCKGREAWELGGLYPSGYVLVRESGVSGGLAFREFPLDGVEQSAAVNGHYLWTRKEQQPGSPGERWNCTFEQYADTQVVYHGIWSLGSQRGRGKLRRLLGGCDFARQAVEDWASVPAQIYPARERRPKMRVIVRVERWGNDFEHVEFYIEGSVGRKHPLSRIGWLKAKIINGVVVYQRLTWYSQVEWSDFKPPRHVGIPGWQQDSEKTPS